MEPQNVLTQSQSTQVRQTESTDFDAEEVKKVVQQAVEMVIDNANVVYQKEKVNEWIQAIVDICIKELAKLGKPFKYSVTCIITQNNGTGLHTAATAFWETKKDGLVSVQFGGAESFYCIVTVFAVAI